MLKELKSMFKKQARVERFDLIQTFYACKQEEGKLVAAYVLKMKGYVKQLERLGYVLPQDLIVGLILNGLTSHFARFVRNYNMHNMGKTIENNKKSLKAKAKGKDNGNGKDKQVYIPKPKNPKPTAKEHPAKDDTYHHSRRHMSRQGASYFIAFTDDYSRYGYVYPLKQKHEVFETFKDYALESATRILNMVPTKKVDKTPYELWAIDLEEIQDEDTSPSEITSKIPMEVEEVEEHSLGDLNEPTSYKAAMLNPKYNKWLDAMNAEMQSMIDNKVWVLVDLPPNCTTVRSKWFFKKKTNMDGIVHTYKACLVAKGYTQLYGVHYEETFSPVADIRAIRILISIAAFYDYEIWKMNVKTSFLNGYLDEDIYMVQLEGFVDPRNPKKVCKLQRSIYGFKQASRSWNKRFDKKIKRLSQSAYMDKILKRYRMDNFKRGHIPMQERLNLNKTQVRCTRPDVAFVQNMTSRFQHNPGEPHWTAMKNILKYLKNTKDIFLVDGGNSEAELRVDCYYDAGFETDRDDTKSQTGYVFVSNRGAEVYFMAWYNKPINMVCDNSTALLIANEPWVQKGVRHYHKRYHYVHECIELGEINLLKVHTDDNLVDLFMKALPKGMLTQHARSIGLC
uniref:Reverse transcriptase Ty1/copia-type domain-containing protein n=1 Tax=Tanacetum cinerariifolium TaxID=118510 RepID=A0A6L2P9M1_TANCI|nr:hypothetical protein [Tanacetum cinerariifolium]